MRDFWVAPIDSALFDHCYHTPFQATPKPHAIGTPCLVRNPLGQQSRQLESSQLLWPLTHKKSLILATSNHGSKGWLKAPLSLSPPFLPNVLFLLLTWAQERAQQICCIIRSLNRECPVFSFAGTPSLCEGSSWHILYLALAGRKVVTQGVKGKFLYPYKACSDFFLCTLQDFWFTLL